MANQAITWRRSVSAARTEAREQGKLVLIDLFNPT
jgi:hypothetical protein